MYKLHKIHFYTPYASTDLIFSAGENSVAEANFLDVIESLFFHLFKPPLHDCVEPIVDPINPVFHFCTP
tara:strand:- start:648 stop:854 length:207 start_codon:yes stop_codon:yes gene_type:complete